jgi:hypothetical protein
VNVSIVTANHVPVVTPVNFSLNEDLSTPTTLGTVPYSDVDAGQNHTVTITSGDDGGRFSIDNAGLLQVANPSFNATVTPLYTLIVEVRDKPENPAYTLAATARVLVRVNPVNHRPIVPAAPGRDLPENSAATTQVGVDPVFCYDVDPGDTMTFSLAPGTQVPSSPTSIVAFTINSTTARLFVANPAWLDFETQPRFVLTVVATDTGLLSASTTVVINLLNVNEAPTLRAQVFTVPENSAVGTTVGLPLVSYVSDPDNGETFTWLVVSGGLGVFDVGPRSGQLVVTTPVLDFETRATYSINVRVNDSGNLTSSAVMTVQVTDVNETPQFTVGSLVARTVMVRAGITWRAATLLHTLSPVAYPCLL